MKTSFDEIRRMAFRALDAGRAPQGVDEDSAVITAWLEASGLPGLKLLGDALDTTSPKERHVTLDPQLEGAQARVDAAGASAVFLGPGLIDLMRCLADIHGSGARLSVDGLRHAGFLMGFIGQAREQGEAFSMSPGDPPGRTNERHPVLRRRTSGTGLGRSESQARTCLSRRHRSQPK